MSMGSEHLEDDLIANAGMDDEHDFFNRASENICDDCKNMQLKLSDQKCPCKRCIHYAK